MKELKFKTSEGKFLLLETLSDNYRLFGFIKGIKLSEITEEQASDIVSSLVADKQGNKSYVYTLHSLLKSKGIHLFKNPYTKQVDENYSKHNRILFEKSEAKTFYNPYIFKL